MDFKQGYLEVIIIFLISTPLLENGLFVFYQCISIIILGINDSNHLKNGKQTQHKQQALLPKSLVLLTSLVWYISKRENGFQVIQHLVTLQVLHNLIQHYKEKFTICEAYLFSSLGIQYLTWFKVAVSSSSSDVPLLCAAKTILGLSIISCIIILCVGRVQSIMKETKYYITLVVLFKMNVLFLIYTLTQQGSNMKALLGDIFTPNFIQYFMILLILTVVPIVIIQKLSFRKIIIRKMFHLQISTIIIVGCLMNQNLTIFALSIVIWLFLVFELLRQVYQEDMIFYQQLTTFLTRFIDEREDSSLILTHIYLIQGITYGLFKVVFDLDRCLRLTSLIGLVVLGVGDSFAAIIGSRYGSKKILHTKKTVEGLLAFIVSSLLVLRVGFGYMESCEQWGYKQIVVISLTGMMELLTSQIDNLLLPQMAVKLSLVYDQIV